MVLKKRTMSISTVMCIVLAVLLVFSLALGFTGAWFTDSASNGIGGTQLQFGTVKVEEKSITIENTSPLLPSQDITFGEIQYVGDVNAYYRIFFDVTNYQGADPTLDELKATLKSNTVQYGLFTVDTAAGKKVTPDPINISEATGNEFQGVSCNFIVTIQVIQQANIPGVQDPANPTDAELAVVFDTYYTD